MSILKLILKWIGILFKYYLIYFVICIFIMAIIIAYIELKERKKRNNKK